MALIIKDKIQMFLKGYPTVSDKYNVAGGLLTGTIPAQFGQLVKKDTTPGYFKAIDGTAVALTAVTEIGGVVLATNVKTPSTYPGNTVQVNPGEAFNLLIDGWVAIELASTAVAADVTAGAAVYVKADGSFTTASDSAKLGSTAIPNCVFTGMIENHGTAASPKYFAEIYVK